MKCQSWSFMLLSFTENFFLNQIWQQYSILQLSAKFHPNPNLNNDQVSYYFFEICMNLQIFPIGNSKSRLGEWGHMDAGWWICKNRKKYFQIIVNPIWIAALIYALIRNSSEISTCVMISIVVCTTLIVAFKASWLHRHYFIK